MSVCALGVQFLMLKVIVVPVFIEYDIYNSWFFVKAITHFMGKPQSKTLTLLTGIVLKQPILFGFKPLVQFKLFTNLI